jgi:hypothetical protein
MPWSTSLASVSNTKGACIKWGLCTIISFTLLLFLLQHNAMQIYEYLRYSIQPCNCSPTSENWVSVDKVFINQRSICQCMTECVQPHRPKPCHEWAERTRGCCLDGILQAIAQYDPWRTMHFDPKVLKTTTVPAALRTLAPIRVKTVQEALDINMQEFICDCLSKCFVRQQPTVCHVWIDTAAYCCYQQHHPEPQDATLNKE